MAESFGGDWRNGLFGDIHQRPDLSTLRMIPDRPTVATCMVDHVSVEGEPLSICPRGLLQRLVAELDMRGYQALFAFEIEAVLFAESFAEARAKGHRNLTAIGTPVSLAYLNQSAHQQAPFMGEVTRRLDSLDIVWEAWNDEMAAGQVELNLAVAVMLTGGLAGLDEQLEPPEPCDRMAWGLPAEQPRLPDTILAAAEALEADERLGRFLGPAFVEHWIHTRRWEQHMFSTQAGDPEATGVTDWELRRYFELF